MSKNWVKLIKELKTKCKEQSVSSLDLIEWIRTSIEQIEKKTFDYYVTSGETPNFPNAKIDLNILLDNYVYSFTIYTNKKERSMFPLKHFFSFSEEISGDFISTIYYLAPVWSLRIEDRVANSAKLREFSRKILNLLWEER